MSLNFEIAKPFSLRAHPNLSEGWLQQQIRDEPSILGLGNVVVIAVEKRQSNAGRLDLLLHDEQLGRRYEVELMLGATDASHIVRTIEYWDIERRRYPAYNHVAVLVAEDVTSRFLNVLSLLAGNIPLIAIKLTAVQVEDRVLLHFVKVLDQTELREDDAYEGGLIEGTADVDRSTWEGRVGPKMLSLCDAVLEMAVACTGTSLELKYKKAYIAISRPGGFFNLVILFPKLNLVAVEFPIDEPEVWIGKLADDGIDVRARRGNRIIINLGPKDLELHAQSVRSVLQHALAQASEDAD
ncbi:hypothetical protein Pla175_11540 [Pirellulimonas nuda]|uniref:DUF5655 domain-containing protein n=1 Tax=Pirellulimonas nuda TaxID=2528009 RepID=A0A518D8I2_9BACT|nr:hypothetical protein [Pirellulimonas nuda]QDU87787.1 hypothetical protein Pla175_11540 [Pirellulimonas nuda]